MKEFIEKLITRLEELNQSQIEKYTECLCEGNLACIYDKTDIEETKVKATYEIIQIVNELAEEYKNDCCEWKQDGVYLICQNHENNLACVEDEGYRYNYCPICGKKIKIVENLTAWKTAMMNTFLARK